MVEDDSDFPTWDGMSSCYVANEIRSEDTALLLTKPSIPEE